MQENKSLPRFSEFEFLKALAIIGLPLVHVMEDAISEGLASGPLKSFGLGIVGLTAFGPSVFMICMGFGIGGGRMSGDSIRKTGIQFLLISLMLNFVRGLLPGVVRQLALGDGFYESFLYFLQSDIYSFVGLFLFCYSFFKKRQIRTFWLLPVSLITLTVNTLLTPLMPRIFSNSAVARFMGNFIYVDKHSVFPLLSWAIFPTVGLILGEVLKKNDEEFHRTFMKQMLICSAVFLLAFVIFLRTYDLDVMKILVSPVNNSITDLPNVLLLIPLACVLIGGAYYLCRAIANTRFMSYMMKISTYIVPFYLLQWVLIEWTVQLAVVFRFPAGGFGFAHYWILVFLVMAICLYVCSRHGMKIMRWITKITKVRKKHKKGGKAVAQ